MLAKTLSFRPIFHTRPVRTLLTLVYLFERYAFLAGLTITAIFLQSCNTDDEGHINILPEHTLLFWTVNGDSEIRRSVYNEQDELIHTKTLFGPIKGLQAPSALTVDSRNALLYWTDFATRQLLRGSWDGSGNPEVLYTAPEASDGPLELTLDADTQLLYWTQPFDNLILRAPADGSGPVDTLFRASDGINGAWGIDLELSGGYLYWIEFRDIELHRSPLDNSSSPELLYAGGSGFLRPFGLAIDAANDGLYIIDNPQPGAALGDRILRGSLDGSSPLETLYSLADGVENAFDIAINGEYIYWHNQLIDGSIFRGSLDGTATPELLQDGINLGQGVEIIRTQLQLP